MNLTSIFDSNSRISKQMTYIRCKQPSQATSYMARTLTEACMRWAIVALAKNQKVVRFQFELQTVYVIDYGPGKRIRIVHVHIVVWRRHNVHFALLQALCL